MLNSEIHRWYQSVFGASPDLIATLIHELGVNNRSIVFDPFCGTGTTNVECKSRLIKSIGTDVNPVSVLASRVKTTWSLDSSEVVSISEELLGRARRSYTRLNNEITTNTFSTEALSRTSLGSDPTFKYLDKYGMLNRGWINPNPLAKTLLIKQEIFNSDISETHKNILLLALFQVVRQVSNIRFGPELYCRPKKDIPCAFVLFRKLTKRMANDLQLPSRAQMETTSYIFEGDARDSLIFRDHPFLPNPNFVITSPPYPTEHDYTRNTRLELTFFEVVIDLKSLRRIKKAMLRSNSKSIYRDDNDGQYVKDIVSIKKIIEEIRTKARSKNYAFAKMYPLIISEYFGGMLRHFKSLIPFLEEGAKCAYIVGDQSTYLGVHIPTADLLCDVIHSYDLGLQVDRILKLWDRRGTTGSGRSIAERVLFFSKKE